MPLPLENVDTDQIIPARFLKATDKEHFGDNLFRDWRYNKDGSLNQNFVLNDPRYSGCILVAGKNFGSGSSREHAAWAIARLWLQGGHQLLLRRHTQEQRAQQLCAARCCQRNFLARTLRQHSPKSPNRGYGELPEQTVTNNATGKAEHFSINGYKKHCLMNGLDDIDYLLQNKNKIEQWEKNNA